MSAIKQNSSNFSLKAIAHEASINFDEGQSLVSQSFDFLTKQINDSNNKKSIVTNFFFKTPKNKIKGIYLHGGVGRGKSMIMDLFFNNINIKDKRRLHFHDFMKEVHQRIKDKSKKV